MFLNKTWRRSFTCKFQAYLMFFCLHAKLESFIYYLKFNACWTMLVLYRLILSLSLPTLKKFTKIQQQKTLKKKTTVFQNGFFPTYFNDLLCHTRHHMQHQLGTKSSFTRTAYNFIKYKNMLDSVLSQRDEYFIRPPLKWAHLRMGNAVGFEDVRHRPVMVGDFLWQWIFVSLKRAVHRRLRDWIDQSYTPSIKDPRCFGKLLRW